MPITSLLPQFVPDMLAQVSTDPAASNTSMRDTVDSLARTPISQIVMVAAVLTVARLLLWPLLAGVPIHKRGISYKTVRFFNEILDAVIYAGVFVFLLIRPFGIQAFVIPSGSMWPTLYVNDYIVANKAVYRYSNPNSGDIVVFRPPLTAVKDQKDKIDADGEVKVDFIKRCIGVPGDVITIEKGVLMRNGVAYHPEWKHMSQCTDAPVSRTDNCQNFRELDETEKVHITPASFKLVKDGNRIIPLNYTENDVNSGNAIGAFTEPNPYFVAEEFQLDSGKGNELKNSPAEKVPEGYYLMMGDNRNNSFDGRGWGLVPRESIVGRCEFIWFPIGRMSKPR